MHATARPSTAGESQRGLTYLALLLAIALVSGVLAASAQVWSQAQRREREAQLLWVGEQFRRALSAYAAGGDGGFPRQLEDLLEDPRSAARRRHLRRLYEDPMTGRADWAVERDGRGGIIAVHSHSTGVPLKTARFPAPFANFEQARSYADWVFAATTPALRPLAPAARAASAPSGAASAAAALPSPPASSAGATAAPDAPATPPIDSEPAPATAEEPPAEPPPPDPD